MKAFLVKDGDIALGPGGYRMVSGAQKVKQDLGIATLEPYGSDRFHLRWGSLLHSYLGQPITDEMGLLIRSEIMRIVRNYMVVQNALAEEDQITGRRSRLTEAEMVSDVDRVQIQTDQDWLRVRMFVRTLSGNSLALVTAVD